MVGTYLKTAFYKFLVYTPVLSIFLLISLIYSSYIIDYCLILVNNQMNQSNEPKYLYMNSHMKGVFYMSLVSFFTVMMLINMIRVIVSDPGFLPPPTELEMKITQNQSLTSNQLHRRLELYDIQEEIDNQDLKFSFLKSKITFLNTLPDNLKTSPLYSSEYESLIHKINYFLNDNPQINNEESYYSFSSDNQTPTNSFHLSTSFLNIKQDNEVFDIFNSLELTKLLLCNTCTRYKVERSHHCRLCGRCILKMDHHCPWLANCIGYNNYKFFLLTQLYGFLSSFLILLSYWEVIYERNTNNNTSIYKIWFPLFVYLTNLSLFVFLIWLIIINWRLAFMNLTVIEKSDKERFPTSKAMNIYDLGKYKNFCSVFGNNPLIWFLPIQEERKGKGIVFENIYTLKGINDIE